MNESTLIQLKIMVERAVRPLRASTGRKRKLREELLAHVSGVFEEEAKLGDEQAALTRTQERFGQAAELTEQLQASVPRGDCVDRFVEDLVFGKATLGRASLFAMIPSLLIGVVLFAVLLAIHNIRDASSMLAPGQVWLIIPNGRSDCSASCT